MFKFYNTQEDFTSGFTEFLKKAIPDIAKVLKDEFSFIQNSSVIKRIRRFFQTVFKIL